MGTSHLSRIGLAPTVLVSGTSTGIGAACVARLAREGWTVYAGVRTHDDGDRLKIATDGDVRPVILDVTDPADIERVADDLGRELAGRGLDGLVNNAGIVVGGPIEMLTDQDWRRQFDVNVFGVVNLTRAVFPLVATARGRFVNVGSMNGRYAVALMGPYAASKHALAAISEALRFEVAGTGMAVSCVEPGAVRTAIWDKVEDLAADVVGGMTPGLRARYRDHLDAMYGYMDNGARNGIDPGRVADAVHHALTAARPHDRYLVGPDALAAGVITRLPDVLRRQALRAAMGAFRRAGRKRHGSPGPTY